jgi:hypothetical protein
MNGKLKVFSYWKFVPKIDSGRRSFDFTKKPLLGSGLLWVMGQSWL